MRKTRRQRKLLDRSLESLRCLADRHQAARMERLSWPAGEVSRAPHLGRVVPRAPNGLLANRSPAEALRKGDSIVIPKLFPRFFENELAVKKLWPTIMGGLVATMGGQIRTQWPIVEGSTRNRARGKLRRTAR